MPKQIETTNYTFELKDNLNVGDLEKIEPIQNQIDNKEIGNVTGIIQLIGELSEKDDKETVMNYAREVGANEFGKLSEFISNLFDDVEEKKSE